MVDLSVRRLTGTDKISKFFINLFVNLISLNSLYSICNNHNAQKLLAKKCPDRFLFKKKEKTYFSKYLLSLWPPQCPDLII